MMMQDDKDTDFPALRKQLQKSFSVLKKCVTTLCEVDAEATTHISKLVNLAEQFQCCSSVSGLPIEQTCPNIRERLIYKIFSDMEKECKALKAHVSTLYTCSTQMEKQYLHCTSCYQHTTAIADIPRLMVGKPVTPALSDMLEWIEHSQRLLRESYLCKKASLERLCPDGEHWEDLEASWRAGDKDMMEQLQGYLAYTTEFLDEKIS